MKEEELIKKLKNVELPDIRLESHQRRLKMALLDADYLKKQRRVTIPSLAKSVLTGVKDTMIKGLISRQPVWKTVTVGVLALALILGLSLTMPALASKSAYAQAAEIVQNSPEMQAALGMDENVQLIEMLNVVNDRGTVIAKGEMGIASAEVDLKTREISEITILMDEQDEESKQKAIDIAMADPEVKELIDSGATIGDVSIMYFFESQRNMETGDVQESSKIMATVEIVGDGVTHVAHINLTEGTLVKLNESPSLNMTPPSESLAESYSVPDTEAVDNTETR